MTKHKRQPRKTIVVRPFLHRLISDGAWKARMNRQDFLEMLILSNAKGCRINIDPDDEAEDDDCEDGPDDTQWLPTQPAFEDGMFR